MQRFFQELAWFLFVLGIVVGVGNVASVITGSDATINWHRAFFMAIMTIAILVASIASALLSQNKK